MQPLHAAKRRLREELRRRCRELPPSQAERAARAVARHLAESPPFRSASRVALYAALPEELGTGPALELVLQAGKTPLLPRMRSERQLEFASFRRWEELRSGRYGVQEPPPEAPALELRPGDLVCVPGVAFDGQGNRLGRGKGYYDRTFAGKTPGAPLLLGLAYDLQLVDAVPHGRDDRPVDGVVTESGVHPREVPQR